MPGFSGGEDLWDEPQADLETELNAQLVWLFAQQRFGVKLGLERVEALLERLEQPQHGFGTVLVGGTNGKGSCASTLERCLREAGVRTALFTSPHLTHFSERFVIGGVPVEKPALLAGLDTVRPHAEAVGASFFEIVTALACLLFARGGVELAVMEVGLGGRFDATNALEPRLSVITGVALDHTEILGDTVAQIAAEKAGILRPERLALTGAADEALAVLRGRAAELNTTLWAIDAELTLSAHDRGWDGVSFEVGSPLGTLAAITPLLGLHQARNVALAAVAAQALGVLETAITLGVARTRWPGRLEPLPFAGRTLLLDGAHNPQAAQALAAALVGLGAAPVRMIFGAAADKALAEIVRALEPAVLEVILTRATLSPRAADPAALAPLWSVPVTQTQTPDEALAVAIAHSQPGEVIVVAGSLYLVGEVRPLLVGDVREGWERHQ